MEQTLDCSLGIFGNMIHLNYGTHLKSGISVAKDAKLQQLYNRIAFCSLPLYNLPNSLWAQRFLTTLTYIWVGVIQHCWNSERPLVFRAVILCRICGISRFHEVKPIVWGWRGAGGPYRPNVMDSKSGHPVISVLWEEHLHYVVPLEEDFDAYPDAADLLSTMPVYCYEECFAKAAARLSGSAGLSGAEMLKHWLLRHDALLEMLHEAMADWVDWLH
jgi:hypothetical protein